MTVFSQPARWLRKILGHRDEGGDYSDEELDRVLNQYREKFGEMFPTAQVKGVGNKGWIERAKKCIESGKPYAQSPLPGARY